MGQIVARTHVIGVRVSCLALYSRGAVSARQATRVPMTVQHVFVWIRPSPCSLPSSNRGLGFVASGVQPVLGGGRRARHRRSVTFSVVAQGRYEMLVIVVPPWKSGSCRPARASGAVDTRTAMSRSSFGAARTEGSTDAWFALCLTRGPGWPEGS